MNESTTPLQAATSALAPPQYRPQVRDILQYPNPTLSLVSEPIVADIASNTSLQALLADMELTMLKTRAVGLAAVQVGVPVRALVVFDEAEKRVRKVINPRLVSISKEMERRREGCMSFVGLFVAVPRPADCVVEYSNEYGEKVVVEGNGLLGRSIQHEIDHLDGKTFLDRLSPFARGEALRKNKIAQRRLHALARDAEQ